MNEQRAQVRRRRQGEGLLLVLVLEMLRSEAGVLVTERLDVRDAARSHLAGDASFED